MDSKLISNFKMTDRYPIPWIHVSYGIFLQLFSVGQTQQWSCSIHDNAEVVMPLAFRVLSIGFSWLLFRLSKGAF